MKILCFLDSMFEAIKWFMIKKFCMLGVPYIICSILGVVGFGWGSQLISQWKTQTEEGLQDIRDYYAGIVLMVLGIILLIFLTACCVICLKWSHKKRLEQDIEMTVHM